MNRFFLAQTSGAAVASAEASSAAAAAVVVCRGRLKTPRQNCAPGAAPASDVVCLRCSFAAGTTSSSSLSLSSAKRERNGALDLPSLPLPLLAGTAGTRRLRSMVIPARGRRGLMRRKELAERIESSSSSSSEEVSRSVWEEAGLGYCVERSGGTGAAGRRTIAGALGTTGAGSGAGSASYASE